jgi:antitoxin HigA-1
MDSRMPTNRQPAHPGRILRNEFLTPLGITQKELAANIKASYQRVNELIKGKRNTTPSTALRLAKFFDTSPELWMNLQLAYDLYNAQQAEEKVLATIPTWKAQDQQPITE